MRQSFDEAKELREQDGTEYKVGAITKFLFKAPRDVRRDYQSPGEVQRNNLMDTVGCGSRAPIEVLEEDLNYALWEGDMSPATAQFLEENSFIVRKNGIRYVEISDAYTAIKSGTTQNGNSLKAPCQALHKWGIVPKKLMPLEDGMTWHDYHNPARITPEIERIAEESTRRLPIKYQKVYSSQFPSELKNSAMSVAGHAWDKPAAGVYQRSEGRINHAFDLYGRFTWNYNRNYVAKDSYEPFHKVLAQEFKFFSWGYQIGFVDEITTPTEQTLIESIYDALATLKKTIDSIIQSMQPATNHDDDNEPAEKSPRERLLQYAKSRLGDEVSPQDNVPDDVACVESAGNVIRHVVKFPDIYGTTEAKRYLKSSPDWKGTLDLTPGNVILCATGEGKTGKIPHGHIGIILENGRIASNNSADGLWRDVYTIDSWVKRWRHEGGYPIWVFELV